MNQQTRVTYTFTNEGESEFPAMGAFAVDSMKAGAPYIRFNLEALIYHTREDEPTERLEIVKEGILELLTHEFCHSLQEYLDMELSEEVVDRILAKYKEEWSTRAEEPVEEEPPMVDAQSAITYMEHIRNSQTLQEAQEKIDQILPSLKSWGYTGQ